MRVWTTILCALLVAPIAVAGPLVPPGAPAPTMKTLDQVEPSVPVGPLTTPGDASALYIISQPGAYHLTADVVAPTGVATGVRITAQDVTLDLRGFAVRGDGLTLAGGAAGVDVQAAHATIRNGTVADWASVGVELEQPFSRVEGLTLRDNNVGLAISGAHAAVADTLATGSANAAFFSFVGPVSFLRSAAIGNPGDGFEAPQVSGASFQECVSADNGGVGFSAGDNARFTDCVADRNGFDAGFRAGADSAFLRCRSTDHNSGEGFVAFEGSRFDDCAALRNGFSGYRVVQTARIRGSVAESNGIHGFDIGFEARIEDSVARSNGQDGIRVGQNAQVLDSSATGNGVTGVRLGLGSAAIRVTASRNNAGISGDASTTIDNCTADDNTNWGVEGDGANAVRDTAARNNGTYGITVGAGSSVFRCVVRGNTNDGIRTTTRSHIAFNTLELNGNGGLGAAIIVTGEGNRIEHNTVTQNGNGIQTGNDRNVIVRNTLYLNAANLVLAAGQTAPTSGSPATAGPWDNITH